MATAPAEQLSFFVYGTLRPTGGNYERILKGNTISEEIVTLNGYHLYGGAKAGFPYAIDGDGEGAVVGTLIKVDPERYDLMLARLDSLEGYSATRNPKYNFYQRKEVDVESQNGTVKAWIYVVAGQKAAQVKEVSVLTRDGDWIEQQKAARARRQATKSAEKQYMSFP